MYEPWSAWSTCSKTCGAGIQTRTRKEAKFSSCSVPQLYTQQTCAIQPCDGKYYIIKNVVSKSIT